MRRKIFTLAIITICLSFLVYGTLAYFTAEDTAHNVITSGEIKIELLEWADDEKTTPFPLDGVGGVLAGSEITKIVEVKNTASNAAYIRIKVEKLVALNPATESDPNPDMLSLDLNLDDWTKEADGFYYYNHALQAGETTKALFTKVSFNTEMNNDYQNAEFSVNLLAQAVQVANQDVINPWDAKGWPEG